MSDFAVPLDPPRRPTLVDSLRDQWYPVARSDAIGEAPVGRRVLDTPIVLWRDRSGQISCFYDLCIHRGTPLSLGWVSGDALVCRYHGWSYGIDGRCVRIPSLPGHRSIPAKARATAYAVAESHGLVWVCLGTAEDGPWFPPYYDAPDWDWQPLAENEFTIQANAARFVENILDVSHFAWVHPGILGDQQYPEMQDYEIDETAEGFEFEIERSGNVVPEEIRRQQRGRVHYTLILPFSVALHGYDPTDPSDEWLTAWICCPLSVKETMFYRINGRRSPRGSIDWSQDNGKVIFEQDRAVVEAQRPEELPLDLREELHLRGPDLAGLTYRKALGRMGLDWQ